VSQEFQLITRYCPVPWALARTLAEAAGRKVDIEGNFSDPDDYLNISGDNLWIEVEPPGHVEYAELRTLIADDVALPEPDEEGCLWHATARVPAGAPSAGAELIWTTFQRLADDHEGVALRFG